MPHASRLRELPSWLLSQAAARSHQLLTDQLAAVGASGYEYRVLAALGGGPASQAEVGRAAALDRRDVTHTVRALESAGLLSRADDPDDARRLVVDLTSAGIERLAELDQVLADVQNDLLAPLTPAQRTQLLRLLALLST